MKENDLNHMLTEVLKVVLLFPLLVLLGWYIYVHHWAMRFGLAEVNVGYFGVFGVLIYYFLGDRGMFAVSENGVILVGQTLILYFGIFMLSMISSGAIGWFF